MSTKLKILAVIVSLSITLSMMSNTYSRYVSGTTGNVELQFAKWQILLNEIDITNNETTSIELTPVVEQSQYVANNKIAPSSKGYFDIDIDPSNVQLSFNYNINLTINNENAPDIMISKYAIIDNDYNEQTETLTKITITDNKITGTLDFDNTIKDFAFEPFTIRIYFEWYDGENETMNDEIDTEFAATNQNSLQITANISFEQKISETTDNTNTETTEPTDETIEGTDENTEITEENTEGTEEPTDETLEQNTEI